MSEMSDGEMTFYDSQRKKQATGGTMLGVGAAILGIELDWLPDLGSLGTTEAVLISVGIAALAGLIVFVTAR